MTSPPTEWITGAQTGQRNWRVPASVSLAQAADETGWGKHMPPGSNNVLGIKSLKGLPSVTVGTDEVIHGKTIEIRAPFAVFPSIEACFDAHAKLIATDPAYAPAMACLPNVTAFTSAMAKVYATDPNYAGKLLEIMEESGLYQYNVIAPEPVSAVASPMPLSGQGPPLQPAPAVQPPPVAAGAKSQGQMTDFSPEPAPSPPAFVTTTVQDVAQHLLTVAAGSLATWGAFQTPGAETQFIAVGVSLALWGSGQLWSIIMHKLHQNNANARVAAALATPAPVRP